MGLERFLPPAVRGPLERLVRWPGEAAYRNALNRRTFHLAEEGVVLNYGGAEPRAGEIVHGGRVKLLPLLEAFPHGAESFNAVYMVSSAIPRNALAFVRWAKAHGARLIWNQNGVAFPAWAGAGTPSINRPMAELFREADFIVYQSDFCRESADRYLGRAKVPHEVLFNPVDLAAFSPASPPLSLEHWELLTAGTHHQPFRVLGAIETLRLLRAGGHPAHLTIAGELRWEGGERQVREAIIRGGFGEAITLHPPFTQAEAATLLRAAHVLLHSKYHDPCPTMVIEALATGVPVVGSKSGGMLELTGDDGGELIPVPLSWERSAYPQPEEIAEAVKRIMGAWSERSRSARARAERLFAKERWVAEHRRIFEACLRR